ncbi:MAG: hypothetical protein ACREQ9_25255, partial [Candidatus Binatia bacterium]
MLRFALAFTVLAATSGIGPAAAREVRLPLTVAPGMIRDALVEQLFTAPGKQAVFWGAPGECSFFYLEDPKVETGGEGIRVTAHGEARFGTELLGGCFSPIVWSGSLEVFEKPRMEGWALHFDVIDSNVYDERGEKALLTGALWDRIKESVHPRLQSVVIDLGEPFTQLRAVLPLLLAPEEETAVQRTLETLRPVSVSVSEPGVTIGAAIEVADAPPPPLAAAPEPPLSDAEIEAFTRHLNEWDAFVTFVVKELGQRTL